MRAAMPLRDQETVALRETRMPILLLRVLNIGIIAVAVGTRILPKLGAETQGTSNSILRGKKRGFPYGVLRE